jgi:hypothetical protein
MHKSIALYAKRLNCSPGHVRRLIRSGAVRSARLVKGAKGRPEWVIDDTSPEAVEALRSKLATGKRTRPIFWEPVLVECFREKGTDGRPSVSYEIQWREIFVTPPTDDLGVLFELADRAALVWHGLTRHDLFHSPVHHPDRWRCVTSPAGERKIKAYYRTQKRLLNAFLRPRTSYTYRWVRRMADANFGTIDIMQAGLQLGLFHKLYGIEIDYRNLSRILGISKSTLYLRYGHLVHEALRVTHKHSRSATQRDQHQIEREEHPGLKLETSQQSEAAFATKDDSNSQSDGNNASDEELHETSVRSRPKDLSFELLLNAAIQLVRRGKSTNPATLTAYLRRRGSLTSTQHVCDFYSNGVIDNAIVAARSTAAT